MIKNALKIYKKSKLKKQIFIKGNNINNFKFKNKDIFNFI